MRLVPPARRRRHLRRQGQRRPRIGPQFSKRRDVPRPRRAEPRPEPRQVRPLGQRVKRHHPLIVRAHRLRRLQHAGRGGVAIDLRIALVREHQEVVLLRQRDQRRPARQIRHRPLRVRRRAIVDRRRSPQQILRQRREVGQEPRLRPRVDVDRLGPRRQRRHRVALVERVGQQHRRPLSVLGLRHQRHAGREQPLPRAGEREHTIRRRPPVVQPIAQLQPAADRLQQLRRAVVRRIAPVARRMLRQHLIEERRQRMPGLPQGHRDRLAPRRHGVEQRPQTRKRIFRQVREPLGLLHDPSLIPGGAILERRPCQPKTYRPEGLASSS